MDGTTNANIIQIPAEEINNLRGEKVSKNGVQLPPGTLVQVAGAVGDQVLNPSLADMLTYWHMHNSPDNPILNFLYTFVFY